MTLLDFRLIIIITVRIQASVLNRFSWNLHACCESTHEWTVLFFGNNWSNRNTDMGKNVPPKLFFGFRSAGTGFFQKNILKPYLVSHFPYKVYIHFCHRIPYSLKNDHAPQKLFFAVILKNIVLKKKYVIRKIFKTSFFTKKFILNFVARCPLPIKIVTSSHKWFFTIFFNLNWRISARFSCSKVYSFERKFYVE